MPHLQALRQLTLWLNSLLMESIILLNNVRFHAFHGVMPQERSVGADFTLSLRLGADVWGAVWNDDLPSTISYAEVYDVVADEMSRSSALLEHVAGRILRRLFTTFPNLGYVWLRLLKDNPPVGAECDGMGVEIEISREEMEAMLTSTQD